MEWVYPHIRRVRSLLRGRGWSSHKTDDLVQDLYVQVLSRHRTGESIRDPEAFLARIALNLSTNAYRREHRELYVGRPVEELGLAANREFAPEECVAAAQ